MNIIRYALIVSFWLITTPLLAQGSHNVKESVDRGKLIYEQNCLACHQVDGSGVPYLAPPLIQGVFVDGNKQKLIEIILNGMQDVEIKGETYANPMPAFDFLTDDQIADVLTFLRSNFQNNGEPVSPEDVLEARKNK